MADSMTAGESIDTEIAQTERIGLGDLVIVAALAAVALVMAFTWQFPCMLPANWNDAVIASGVRPACAVVPGLWRFLGAFVYDTFGIDAGNSVLQLLGHLSLAAIAIGVYATLRELLAFVMRARPQLSRRRTLVMRIASAVGALAFVCADAVWAAGQDFCETSILVLLFLSALEFYFLFLRKGTLKYAYLGSLILGLLVAESPLGIVVGLVFIGIYSFILRVMPALESPFFKPAVIAVGKWHMTFIFLAALIGGIVLNCVTFTAHDGLLAVDGSIGDLPLRYLKEYWGLVASAADILGWLLWVGVALAPFLVTLVRFPAAADEEQFLSYSTGIVFLACGVVSAAQSCALPALWYWTYGTVGSQFLLCVGSFFSALTLAGAVTILGVDSLCRNHERLATQAFGADEEDLEPPEDDSGSRSYNVVRLGCLFLVPCAIAVAIVPGRVKEGTREMLSVLRDYAMATVDESGDAEYLFTDGNLDLAVELESARRGGELKCVSLLGGEDKMSVYLRTRGLGDDKESSFSFGHDGGMGLRTWMRDKPAMLARSAVQIGFDLWKRDGKAIPEIGGFVSRPATPTDAGARRAMIDRSKALAERIVALHGNGGYRACTDRKLASALTSVQWRLARMCTYRSERADLAGEIDEAIEEISLASKLNDCNGTYKELVETIAHHNELLLTRLTPREGLQLALVRADFTMGKFYAETILAADPGHPDANFAMGMYYLKQRQLSRAEEYLKRCLIGKPHEPSIYNNLAMIQMERGKYDAALVNVEKALAIIPDSSAVRDTKKLILEKLAEKKGEKDKAEK